MRRRSWAVTGGALIAVIALGVGLGSASASPARPLASLSSGLVASAQALGRASVRGLETAKKERETRAARLTAALRDMPDLTQTDPALGVEGGGDSWCGPVAVSNALVWLGEHGHETLLPNGKDRRARQLELVRRLGSDHFMGTTPTGGTGTSNLLSGLQKYLRESGLTEEKLAYQGWRGHPFRFTTGVKIPELGFIAEGLRRGGIAVIHAGWYKKSPFGADFYRRNGGHWLTVVGTEIDENGNPSPGTLVVHDPAPYAGSEPARVFVKLEPLESGWLDAENGAFPAKGYSRLAGGMHIKRDGEIAILDGAVVLELER